MKKFTVADSPARFGSGAIVGLAPAQLTTRRHNVRVLDAPEQTVEGITLVEILAPIEFKIGEELLVEGEGAVAALVDPLSGQKQSRADRGRSARRKAATKKPAPAKSKR